ncbi:MAG: exodeoxyribonuclease VII large subunit [Firmicutes bacterium]|nr:exodeoxyribonuclease VII large subunit [Bacillota bacterium]
MAETVRPRVYGVAEITYYLKEYLAEDDFLSSLAVCGEVSGFKRHSSGHVYFNLREENCGLKTVMFRQYAASLHWTPREGEQVVVIGRVALFERDAVCQLYAETVLPAGDGAASRAREELKARLQAEGLFDQSRKKPLPAFARRVGIVTAPGSAALADMERIIKGRQPATEITVYPALVQGTNAPASLAAALLKADRGGHDVLICGRGGGPGAELSAFDSEEVVRALAGLRTPVISAVGHESDFSLADLAADVRAATPTHAAALAVPETAALLALLADHDRRLREALRRGLIRRQARLTALASRPVLARPAALLEPAGRRVERAESDLQRLIRARLRESGGELAALSARLELLSPLHTLERGYAVVSHEGRVMREAASVQPGDRVEIRLARGRAAARIEETEEA